MKAIVVAQPGGPDVLRLGDVADIAPQRGEVRVKVHATAVNRADILQRMGKYPPPRDCPQNIPGLEYSGTIDAVGEGVIDFTPGDSVFGLVGGGSYAENIVVHSRTVARMPANISFVEAAAIPEAFITAYDAMITQCHLQTGETVLIHAAASGVGTAAIQIAKAMGARAIGTSRSEDKLERAAQLGLNGKILVKEPTFAEEVLKLTDGKGADVVLELVSGPYVGEDLKCAAVMGRIIIVGLIAGNKVDMDMSRVLSRRLRILGTTLRARPLEEKIEVNNAFQRSLLPLVAGGALKPVIDKVFPIEKADEAHRYVESNESFGKVILTFTG